MAFNRQNRSKLNRLPLCDLECENRDGTINQLFNRQTVRESMLPRRYHTLIETKDAVNIISMMNVH